MNVKQWKIGSFEICKIYLHLINFTLFLTNVIPPQLKISIYLLIFNWWLVTITLQASKIINFLPLCKKINFRSDLEFPKKNNENHIFIFNLVQLQCHFLHVDADPLEVNTTLTIEVCVSSVSKITGTLYSTVQYNTTSVHCSVHLYS